MSVAWACPNCKVQVTTPFCATCGEHPLKPRELTLRQLLRQLFVVFSSLDGKVLRTLRTLITRPGELTRAFFEGRRKPFIGGFQIFILANVLFFAMQSLTKMKIFTNTLDYRLNDDELLGAFGRALVDTRLAATGRTFDQYAPVFNQAVATNAKSLIGLMVPVLALVPPLLFWRRKRPFAVHVIFALHFYAFLLLLFCVPLAATAIDSAFGGSGVPSQAVDDVMSIGLLLACATYLYAAIGPAYDAHGFARVLQAAALTIAVMFIFFGYRFALVPITLYTT